MALKNQARVVTIMFGGFYKQYITKFTKDAARSVKSAGVSRRVRSIKQKKRRSFHYYFISNLAFIEDVIWCLLSQKVVMPLFSKKKKNAVIPPKPTTTAKRAPAPAAPPPSHQKQVIKIVGEEKHIKTERYDELGRKIVQNRIVALTEAEKEQFGIGQSAAPAANNYHQQQQPTKTKTQHIPPPSVQEMYKPPEPGPQTEMKQPPTSQTQNNNMPMTSAAAVADTASIANSRAPTTITNISFGDESLAKIEITRELVKRFITDIWNRGEVELIPEVCHRSLRFNGHIGMDRVGHEGFARMVTTVREALTDYHCEIHSMVVESNKAFCRLRFTGKHTGNLLGYPPTGKTVSWMGASEFTCKDGKILKVWELGDVKSLEDQLRSSE
jgi:steroid delta-isomerase-like uncharacterized protein